MEVVTADKGLAGSALVLGEGGPWVPGTCRDIIHGSSYSQTPPQARNMQGLLTVLWPEVELGREAGDVGAGRRAGGDSGQQQEPRLTLSFHLLWACTTTSSRLS